MASCLASATNRGTKDQVPDAATNFGKGELGVQLATFGPTAVSNSKDMTRCRSAIVKIPWLVLHDGMPKNSKVFPNLVLLKPK